VPAAAVIPAPRVYTKAVAVKTLVVEFLHPVPSFWEMGLGVLSNGYVWLPPQELRGRINHSNALSPAMVLNCTMDTPP
jgi:hypothetical protein